MTIKDAVKAAIAALPGNKPIPSDLLIPHESGTATHHTIDGIESRVLGTTQIMRAIRDLPHVQRDGKGNYRVRGRRVPQR